MQIVLVTDAWDPQVNGVVRNYKSIIAVLEKQGHAVRVISPLEFASMPCPTYPEISLSLFPRRKLARLIDAAQPDAVHIATEGPLGWAARAICQARGWPFSTCYHSKFPEYIEERFHIPVNWSYQVMRHFHAAARHTVVTNEDLRDELAARGFDHLRLRTMGVDATLFKPATDKTYLNLPRPLFVCHGRVAPEKNLEAFLRLDLPGSKLVVGPGPLLPKLQKQFPKATFTGYLPDPELARTIAAADAFVFPSLTETFGLVQLEALACGVPVAAFPVTGPKAVLQGSDAGVLHHDLGHAAMAALKVKPALCRTHAKTFTWEAAAEGFMAALTPLK